MELLVTGGAGHAGFSFGKRSKSPAGNVNYLGTFVAGKKRSGCLSHAFISVDFNSGVQLKTGAPKHSYFITSPFTAPRIPMPSMTCGSSIQWALPWPRQCRRDFAACTHSELHKTTLHRNAATLHGIH